MGNAGQAGNFGGNVARRAETIVHFPSLATRGMCSLGLLAEGARCGDRLRQAGSAASNLSESEERSPTSPAHLESRGRPVRPYLGTDWSSFITALDERADRDDLCAGSTQ
jgi:hypothetical protein